jgi:hypothetical protein
MLPAIGNVLLSTVGNGSITQFPILTMPNDVWSLNRLEFHDRATTCRDFGPVCWEFGQTLQFAVECFLAGWWFGSFFIFHNIWDNPSH